MLLGRTASTSAIDPPSVLVPTHADSGRVLLRPSTDTKRHRPWQCLQLRYPSHSALMAMWPSFGTLSHDSADQVCRRPWGDSERATQPSGRHRGRCYESACRHAGGRPQPRSFQNDLGSTGTAGEVRVLVHTQRHARQNASGNDSSWNSLHDSRAILGSRLLWLWAQERPECPHETHGGIESENETITGAQTARRADPQGPYGGR